MRFVERTKFERLGVFEYSREKGTYSYSLKPQVGKRVMHQRYKTLMTLQNRLSKEVNNSLIGEILPCIVEAITDEDVVVMRSQYDAPEIDGLVYAKVKGDCCPGDIYNVRITKVDDYDLYGEIEED